MTQTVKKNVGKISAQNEGSIGTIKWRKEKYKNCFNQFHLLTSSGFPPPWCHFPMENRATISLH